MSKDRGKSSDQSKGVPQRYGQEGTKPGVDIGTILGGKEGHEAPVDPSIIQKPATKPPTESPTEAPADPGSASDSSE